ncbi:MAG: ATP-binding protein involved in chromosome partitioning [Rickettsiales bacterium]|jgi:ATP-binding protein involved in chromosome partitioning
MFGTKKTDDKILKIINKININDICEFEDLTQSKSISQIIVKDDKISFSIDIGILKIDSLTANNLTKKITAELQKKFNQKINIILTKDKAKNIQEKPTENLEDQAPLESKKEEVKKSVVPGVKNIIVVASGKGGVGKSTVAANLAISLKKIGYKIGLADADIYGPSITYLMNLQGKPESENKLMIPINSYGIDCISVGSIVDASKATVWRGPVVTKVLTQLISGTKWNDIDYLIIDLPPGTGDVHLSLIQQFKPDGAVLVSTPQNLAIIDVIKAVDMFKTLQVPVLGVIQNMAYLIDGGGEKNYVFGKDLAKNMASDLGLNFLGDIPLSSSINEANDQKSPICYSKPSSEIAFEFGRISENILDNFNKT